MNSLLGKQIEIMQNMVLEVYRPKIVERFMAVYRDFNEEPITEFVFLPYPKMKTIGRSL